MNEWIGKIGGMIWRGEGEELVEIYSNSSCASKLDVGENLMRWWHQYNIMALGDDLLGGCKYLIRTMNIKMEGCVSCIFTW